MYDVKEPKFVIKMGFDRKLLLDEQPDLNDFRNNFVEQFRLKFRGVMFKVELVHTVPNVWYFIYFAVPPHKTVVKKMLNWIKRYYRVVELDISGV